MKYPRPSSPLSTESARQPPTNPTKHRKNSKEKTSNGSVLSAYDTMPATTAVFGQMMSQQLQLAPPSRLPTLRQRSLAQEFGTYLTC